MYYGEYEFPVHVPNKLQRILHLFKYNIYICIHENIAPPNNKRIFLFYYPIKNISV